MPEAWLAAARGPGPGLATLTVTPALAAATTWAVTARFATAVPPGATVNVLWKPFDSQSDWSAVPAIANPDGSYGATVAGGALGVLGALFAAELVTPVAAWRYPDPLTATPYVSVAP